jgi:hypothetical protein
MAIDYRSELRRPTPLGLLALALVGWLVVVVLLMGLANQRDEQELQLGLLRTSEGETRRQLDQQRAASGTLAELQARTAAASSSSSRRTGAAQKRRCSWPMPAGSPR